MAIQITGGGSGQTIVVSRTSDSASKTDATLASDTQLLFAASINAGYKAEGFLLVSAANATMDFKYNWSVPAATTGYHGGDLGDGQASQAGFGHVGSGTTPAGLITLATDANAGTGTSNSGITGIRIVAFFFTSSTAGNITLQWAQNTVDAGALLLKSGSHLVVNRLF